MKHAASNATKRPVVVLSEKQGRPFRQNRQLRARYDAAQTTVDNANWWAAADLKSADASASAGVRKTLRSRARYEIANSPYARRIINVLARDVIGTGPRLQMHLDDTEANRIVEREFRIWSATINLARKLNLARKAKAGDGEAFLFLAENLGLPDDVVPLDVVPIECDRITTPVFKRGRPGKSTVDGIEFDAYGNPAFYHVLKSHPGDSLTSLMLDYESRPARDVIHWFAADRPGQHRGIPEITAALPRLVEFRRWTNAVIDAAQNAAHLSPVFYTEQTLADDEEIPAPLDVIELERDVATVAPYGYKIGGVKAEHPATTHRDFARVILTEIGACFEMPYNIAVGDSSDYNYASGRLDHQAYFKKIRDDRHECEITVLDRILKAFIETGRYRFAGVRPDLLLQQWRAHTWEWDGDEHVDPDKESRGQERRLRMKTTSPQRECAKAGGNWEEIQDENVEAEMRERRKRLELQKKYGLSDEDMAKTDQAMRRDQRGASARAQLSGLDLMDLADEWS